MIDWSKLQIEAVTGPKDRVIIKARLTLECTLNVDRKEWERDQFRIEDDAKWHLAASLYGKLFGTVWAEVIALKNRALRMLNLVRQFNDGREITQGFEALEAELEQSRPVKSEIVKLKTSYSHPR